MRRGSIRGTQGFGSVLLGLCLAAAVPRISAQAAPLPPGTSDAAATSPEAGTEAGSRAADHGVEALANAEAKLEAKEYAGAEALLAPYLAAHPNDARALFDEGYVEDAEEHPVQAESHYRQAIAADPQQFEARLALGLLLAGRARADPAAAHEAGRELEAATRLEPKPANPAAQAQAGRALAELLRTSDPEGARQALLAALKLSPESTADTLLAAEIAEGAGDKETAEQAYRSVLAKAPAGAGPAMQATTGLAHLLITAHQYPEAEVLLRQALTQDASNPVLNAQLTSVLMAEGKSDQAVAVLETLHAGRPEDQNITRMLADLYTQGGQAAKADSLYMQLLAQPGAPATAAGLLAARGDNLIRQQRFAEAAEVLQRATRLDAANGNAWSSLAFAASESHQPQLTLDALAMRSKVMTETPGTYFLAATAWDTLHQTRRAVDMYKQFLAVAGGKFPDEEWEAKHRLITLTR